MYFVGSAKVRASKRCKTLLDALVTAPSDVHLVIAGIGSQAEPLKDYAQRLGISERVVFWVY